MKSFRYLHSKAVWVLLGLITVLCSAGCVLNVINAIANVKIPIKFGLNVFIAIVTFAMVIFAISVIISSKYYVKKDCLVLSFGLIHSKTSLKEAESITFIPFKNKLVMFFTDNRYLSIVIDPNSFSEFVSFVRSVNPDIVYNVDNIGMDDAKE
jgi:hypothetical protein